LKPAAPPCGQCGERPALLPARLQLLVPAGEFCRDCLAGMHERTMRTALEDCEPLEGDPTFGFHGLVMEMELLRIQAALEEPEPADEREVNSRWSRLLRERFGDRES
jgi:hypothetical protein